MLFLLDKKDPVKTIPHQEDFNSWMKNLSDSHYRTIIEFLDEKLETEEIITSSWIPGKHWGGTIFEPLYTACGKNHTKAAFFLGLLLYDYMMKREDEWVCGRFELNGKSIRGLTYFRKTK